MTRGTGTVAALASTARHQFLIYATAWKFTVVFGVVQPAVLLLVNLNSTSDPVSAARVVSGIVLMALWTNTVWRGAIILQLERVEGVLAPGLFGLRSALVVLIGKSLGSSLLSAASVLATVGATLAVLRQPVDLGPPVWVVAGLVVVLLSGTAVGVLLSCVFLVSRHGSQISGALMYPVYLLSGLLIPLSLFPRPVRLLSWLISFRWAMEFFVSCAQGDPDLRYFGLTLLLSAAYALAGYRVFGYVSRRARVYGTLDLE
ncbi:ABC transporter permease [Streptomyces olivaceoviridis]